MSDVIKANGTSVFRIGFDPKAYAALPHHQREKLFHHFDRVLMGEASAVSEWEFCGLKVDVIPWTPKPARRR